MLLQATIASRAGPGLHHQRPTPLPASRNTHTSGSTGPDCRRRRGVAHRPPTAAAGRRPSRTPARVARAPRRAATWEEAGQVLREQSGRHRTAGHASMTRG